MDLPARALREGHLRIASRTAAAAAFVLATAVGAADAGGGRPGAPRVGSADLSYTPSFRTIAGKTGRRNGILDGTVEGRFGPEGKKLTAAFVRLEVTSRWPLVSGGDVRDNSGYSVYLVTPEEAASGTRVAGRLRMGDSTYRLAAPREMLGAMIGDEDRPLLDRLPAGEALTAIDLDGDGVDEILAFFRRQLASSARPEERMHVFKIEGRAVVDTLSIPLIIPDVSENFDFWGLMVGQLRFEPPTSTAPATIAIAYERTKSAEDQRTDASPPNDFPPRSYPLPGK